MKQAYVVGTFDTKAEELAYVAELIRNSGTSVVTVDVSSKPREGGGADAANPDISNSEVARHHRENPRLSRRHR
ncbi:MAG: Tm-1-like ATP-binding domain-containing protein [Alkalispirochaeta sp.]